MFSINYSKLTNSMEQSPSSEDNDHVFA